MILNSIEAVFSMRNGVEIPVLGLGVFKASDGEEVMEAVRHALDCGYRSIDTASIYGNERGVGAAIEKHGIPRSEIFLTTKVWNTDQGYKKTMEAFHHSLERLRTDYLDLYLVHWPVEGLYKETWSALEDLYDSGKVRAIGVSNFNIHHLEDILSDCRIVPMVNQVEFHPFLVQNELHHFCRSEEILTQAWSPILRGRVNNIALLNTIGEKYGKNAVQVTLRWEIQKAIVVIPKSVRKDRIQSNADIFDFELSPLEVELIDALNKNERVGPDPENFDF
jgi:diketogulonate reductase-like aldo/keto reductase